LTEPSRKHHLQQQLYCVCIHCCGNIFTHLLPRYMLHNTIAYSPTAQQWLYMSQYIHPATDMCDICETSIWVARYFDRHEITSDESLNI
jgi:hypothetical protein